MLAARKRRRRVDDALAVASPVALTEAMDELICGRSIEDVRALIARSAKRMDPGDRAQLQFYLNPDESDDLLGHRFSAFLRQNPRAFTALDADAIEAILAQVGEMPEVQRTTRRLPAPTAALVALAVVVTMLPLAAEYAHQRGLLQGLTDPISPPPIIAPFVQRIILHRASAPPPRKIRQTPSGVVAQHYAHPRRAIAQHPHKLRHRRHAALAMRRRPRRLHHAAVAWKFDRGNNPYFTPLRWRHPYEADDSPFGERARLSVRSYLHAIVDGNFAAALMNLGMSPAADTKALAEMPIVARSTRIAILGSKAQPDGREQVQAQIVTDNREYYAVFSVAEDGAAVRIVDHYFIPVNHSAQVAFRSLKQNPH